MSHRTRRAILALGLVVLVAGSFMTGSAAAADGGCDYGLDTSPSGTYPPADCADDSGGSGDCDWGLDTSPYGTYPPTC